MIKVGDAIPAANITVVYADNKEKVSAPDFFANKKIVVFALPGAFTKTCSSLHLPGYIALADDFFAKGIDAIACLSVNDAAVMLAWQKDQQAEKITMLADGNANLTKALSLDKDTGDMGGIRSKRYAMIVDQGIITHLHIEEPKEFKVSDAQSMLALVKLVSIEN